MRAAEDLTPVVVAARRTAVATAGQHFAQLTAAELAAPVLQALVAQAHLTPPEVVDDVILGMARSPGGNPARMASLLAGLDVVVPAVTIDRQCGSGLAAITMGADMVRSGTATVVLAGGMESASLATPGRAAFAPASIGDPDMGPAAQDLADARSISRQQQDSYAARSHARALEADLSAEIVPIAGLSVDPRPRRMSPALLARMPAAFSPYGTVTAGNSCGISDGAAAVVIVPEWWRAERGLPGLALRSWCAVGVDPRLPGMGPAPAIRRVLEQAGMSLDAVDVLEIVEAFAAQLLAVTDDLGLDALGADGGRICPLGGAIAIGHPWGASGAIAMVRLFTLLARPERAGAGRRPRVGIAACAVGGGMGIAALVERVGPGDPGGRR